LDPNRASAAELELLPGIGPSLAGRIVADRQLHGPFATVEELERVKGIGARTVERLSPLLRPSPINQGPLREDLDGGNEGQFRDE